MRKLASNWDAPLCTEKANRETPRDARNKPRSKRCNKKDVSEQAKSITFGHRDPLKNGACKSVCEKEGRHGRPKRKNSRRGKKGGGLYGIVVYVTHEKKVSKLPDKGKPQRSHRTKREGGMVPEFGKWGSEKFAP